MKILIIGASGLLAKPVIKQLDKQGFQIRLFSRTVTASMFDKTYELVQGDVLNPSDLDKAMTGCDAIHISLSKVDERLATKTIVEVARQKQIKLISIITGCTVADENRWFWMIENKYQAEQAIIHSGIPYMIFRPTWFFESLELMVRNRKAMIIGKQINPYRWIAADDYAQMVSNAYQKQEARNKIFYIYGPESFLMKDALTEYCKQIHPEIKKVSTIPLGLINIIAFLTRNKELKTAASMFGYFEKVKEQGSPDEANVLLGKPKINFQKWIELRKSNT
jgi:uncharacterized protein YbjT (DUF2867 family)